MNFVVLDSDGDSFVDFQADTTEAAKARVVEIIKMKQTARGLARSARLLKLCHVVGELAVTETAPPLSFSWDPKPVHNDQEEDEPEYDD